MQVMKRIVKYRSTRYPELVAVNHWLSMEALDACRREHGDVTALYDRLHAGRDMTAGSTYDDTSGAEWLSGCLKDATNSADVVRLGLLASACRRENTLTNIDAGQSSPN